MNFCCNNFMFDKRPNWAVTALRMLFLGSPASARAIAGKGARIKPVLTALHEMSDVGLVEQHGDQYRLAARYVSKTGDGDPLVTWPWPADHPHVLAAEEYTGPPPADLLPPDMR